MLQRKTSISTAAREKEKQSRKKETQGLPRGQKPPTSDVNPVLAGILQRSTLAETGPTAPAQVPPTNVQQQGMAKTSPHHAVAQAAVGRGIRHTVGRVFQIVRPLCASASQSSSSLVTSLPSAELLGLEATSDQKVPSASESNPLSQLTTNFKNSLNDMESTDAGNQSASQTKDESFDNMLFPGGFLKRDDSLVDLAMIAPVENSENQDGWDQSGKQYCQENEDVGFSFIDFPNPDIFPPT